MRGIARIDGNAEERLAVTAEQPQVLLPLPALQINESAAPCHVFGAGEYTRVDRRL